MYSPVDGKALHCFKLTLENSEVVNEDGDSQIVLLYIQIK